MRTLKVSCFLETYDDSLDPEDIKGMIKDLLFELDDCEVKRLVVSEVQQLS